MDNTTILQVSNSCGSMDKYTASIELSNACREFYRSRIKAAEVARKKLENDNSKEITGSANTGRVTPRKKTSIDFAMEHLRKEMASLMDQDLSLMKQLLILNEAIEDLKWQRGYVSSTGSLPASSCDIEGSECSVSETEMFESDKELLKKYPTSSSLSVQSAKGRGETKGDFDDVISKANKKLRLMKPCTDQKLPSIFKSESSTLSYDNNKNILEAEFCFSSKQIRVRHEEQNSFDSGIHEPIFNSEIAV